MPQSSVLADLIDLYTALHADGAGEADRKKSRDRKLGATLSAQKGDPARQLRGWLERVEIPGWQRDGRQAVQLYHVLGVILAVAGLIVGWGLVQAVLHYTGDAPINVIHALAVLILPQLVLLLFWLLAMLRVPLLGHLGAVLRFLNPGRLTRLVAQRFPTPAEQRLGVLWDPENAVVLAPAARWLFSLWSQLFSVAFNVGALLAMLYLIAFSDLAFGWSTTLNLDSGTFHRFVGTLAWPWHGFAPEAVPSASLVESSRYFRLETGALGSGPSAERAVLLGGWWPFLVAALVCYGLLPRLLTLLISWQRLHHHLRHGLPRLPGAPELLARMNSPLVSTAALQPEAVAEIEPHKGLPRPAAPLATSKCAVVAWSGSIAAPDRITPRLPGLGLEPTVVLHAGGARTTAEDAETIARLCTQREQGVAVVAKAWEPPLLEFVDFVQQVRARCTAGQAIIVLLWGGEAPVSDSDAEVWRLTLRQLKDPDLHIEAIP